MNLKEISRDTRLPAAEIHPYRHFKFVDKRLGYKVQNADNSDEQREGEEVLVNLLIERLSIPRVNSISRKSVGEWDPERKAVRLSVKTQRHFIDYTANGFEYLHYCNALYDFETNILEIRRNNSPISLEEAYLLLIGNDNCLETYTVFSELSQRAILVPYDEDEFIPEITERDCIFEVLRRSLNPRHPLPDSTYNSQIYQCVEAEFHIKVGQIKSSQTIPHTEFEEPLNVPTKFNERVGLKRKHKDQKQQLNSNPKRLKLSENTFHQSLLNQLLIEDEYKIFEETFEKLQKIEIKIDEDEEENEDEDIKFMFDLHPLNKIEHFQPSRHLPLCRVIIVKANEPFPTAGQIRRTCKKQKYRLPLLITAVSEFSQVTGYIYYFS